jgi:hypothetical protein
MSGKEKCDSPSEESHSVPETNNRLIPIVKTISVPHVVTSRCLKFRQGRIFAPLRKVINAEVNIDQPFT